MHKPLFARRFCMMAGGITVMGFAIALFDLTGFGTDPFTACTMALAGAVGIAFPLMSLVLNCAVFCIMLVWARERIGPGTFFNWFGVAPLTAFFAGALRALGLAPRSFPARFVLLAAALAVLGLAVSLYQSADLGTSPYDSTSLVLAARGPVPYFWCRIATDAVCTGTALVLGGVVGLGTALAALATGPFVSFFDRHVSRRLLS